MADLKEMIKGTSCARLNDHIFSEVKEVKEVKKRKYNNEPVEFDGLKFDSLKERDRYIGLRALQSAGEITELNHHVVFRLESNDSKICDYEADFTYLDKYGKLVVEDVKSPVTNRLRPYLMKKAMMLAQYGIEIKEV